MTHVRQTKQRRVGVYGMGVVAPGAKDLAALEDLLRSQKTALRTSDVAELGRDLFAVGDPAFAFEDYAPWIAARHGEAYFPRMKRKMGDNVRFAVGATIQALEAQPGLEKRVREADEACHVYIGSGVGDLPESRAASHAIERATRIWNHFWASVERCPARRAFEASGFHATSVFEPPPNPRTLSEDSVERAEAAFAWDAFWAAQSPELQHFYARFIAIERLDAATASSSDTAHLDAIRRRLRAHRALIQEFGCPPPPFASVSANLIWNIQNAAAAQITMLLGVHGAAFAPVGACSTFGVALKCGRDAILRGEAKVAIVGTTDPRPDTALAAAFYDARVMSGSGDVQAPLTSLRGTHLAGGACVWILGDVDYMHAAGLEPTGGWLEGVALSSDAEHIITPSESGPKRALVRAYSEADIAPCDVAVMDLHATGTPGDLTELGLVQEFISRDTWITARKGQLGHGMANSGGWECTALALGLARQAAFGTSIDAACINSRIPHRENIVTDYVPLQGDVGVKLMLGIGGITACVVLRRYTSGKVSTTPFSSAAATK